WRGPRPRPAACSAPGPRSAPQRPARGPRPRPVPPATAPGRDLRETRAPRWLVCRLPPAPPSCRDFETPSGRCGRLFGQPPSGVQNGPQVLPGVRTRVLGYLLRRAFGDKPAPQVAPLRAQIAQPVGGLEHL